MTGGRVALRGVGGSPSCPPVRPALRLLTYLDIGDYLKGETHKMVSDAYIKLPPPFAFTAMDRVQVSGQGAIF